MLSPAFRCCAAPPDKVELEHETQRKPGTGPGFSSRSWVRSEHAERVLDEGTDFVAATEVAIAGISGNASKRATQAQGEVLGRAALHHVLDLVEDLALLAVAGLGGLDVVART